ncbi:membrane fusion protein (multidrug efflux system) [Pedobacter sp. W3I1]|uniref:efflux RND transporter periplasmic adaptor subunit n=1 Tax=Pedobacter sp. W3I1 TaxID=3042291 RepID=UPI002783B102|nr:efflux RND transporter periplasmic adaptor subunit [Pedobacter sp. W3I1]MDQ0640227.1 membrane fusion protein (multidrug efflux system) [Pedobacter sp. W3I1]
MKTFPILILGLLSLNACRPTTAHVQKKTVTLNLKAKLPRVKTYKCIYRDLDYQIETSGKIRADRQLKVIAEVTGRLITCNLSNNSVVTQGSQLLSYDLKSVDLQIEKIKNSIFTSRMAFESDILSQESLLKGKSKGIRDTVYRKLKVDAGLSAAEIELRSLFDIRKNAVVRAPISGTIADVKIQNGMYIRNGDELFTIYSHNELTVETKILESDVASVKVGQLGVIRPIASDKDYQARVSGINPLVDESGMVSIKLAVVNDGQSLLPGMHVTVNISIPVKHVLLVPKDAILFKNSRGVVFTMDKGLAKWSYVVMGRENGNYVEILDGLAQNQKVIISNNLQLSHDTRVEEIK